ncbi:hypothetical protein B296_00025656 [Ensete ventricosum]|uniref:Uncharacterized protein n=1 Tax=Ensete ventricosum TaxID=4639 RepID=A0A426YC74_ENSVE|nr:hypothetical protein B296_00025656 [Ensete ventricosum]
MFGRSSGTSSRVRYEFTERIWKIARNMSGDLRKKIVTARISEAARLVGGQPATARPLAGVADHGQTPYKGGRLRPRPPVGCSCLQRVVGPPMARVDCSATPTGGGQRHLQQGRPTTLIIRATSRGQGG